MDDKQDMKIALLIDSDNVSAKYISSILSLLSKYGKITIRRMYGDWSQDRLRPWLHCSAAYSLEPIMQMNFCIASSDGDFNKLAKRLREAGKMVIGMGEKKTPEAFRASCERFIYLDVDSPETEEDDNTEPARAASAASTVSKAAAGSKKKTSRAASSKRGASQAPAPDETGRKPAGHAASAPSQEVTDSDISYNAADAPVISFTPRKEIPSSTSSTTTTPTARTPLSVRSASASPSSTRILTYRTTATPN